MILDLHVHTSRYSPCSRMSPDELLVAAKAKGLDGICLTEHQTVWPRDEARDLARRHGLAVFRGLEATTTAGDILVFGPPPENIGVLTPEELRRLVDDLGGLAVLAHPFRGFLVFGFTGLSLEAACDLPVMRRVSGLETVNPRVTDAENDLARRVAERLGLLSLAGSDAHSTQEVGAGVTIFDRNLDTEEALAAALKAGRFTIARRY
ncbi:MAG: PHP domain-containing protein [Thermodesulfobacteriota bacterium]